MSKIDGVCMGSWSSFCFLRSKVGRVTGRLTIRFCGEVTGHLLYTTGHLYCGFSALILEGVAAIQLPEWLLFSALSMTSPAELSMWLVLIWSGLISGNSSSSSSVTCSCSSIWINQESQDALEIPDEPPCYVHAGLSCSRSIRLHNYNYTWW